MDNEREIMISVYVVVKAFPYSSPNTTGIQCSSSVVVPSDDKLKRHTTSGSHNDMSLGGIYPN